MKVPGWFIDLNDVGKQNLHICSYFISIKKEESENLIAEPRIVLRKIHNK